MEISQLALARLSFVAFLLGFALGALYGLLQAIGTSDAPCPFGFFSRHPALHRFYARPKRKPHPRIKGLLSFFMDFAFCILVAISIILLFYQGNNGKLRAPILVCMLLGAVLYRALLSSLMLLFWKTSLALLTGTVRLVCYTVAFPFLWLLKRAESGIRCGYGALRMRSARRGRRRYTEKLLCEMERNALGMIGEEEKGNENGNRKNKEKAV